LNALIMAGLVPAIHVFVTPRSTKNPSECARRN
jgi:hypothetical protein